MVCTMCHQSLGGGGRGLEVNATGEFRVPTESEVMHAVGASESGDQLSASSACSWCGKPEHEVKKLIGRSGTSLCNECVSLASDIMDAELGTDWR